MKDKNTYSLKSNYQYVYRLLWKYSKKIILFGIMEILFTVIVPLIGAAIPAVIVALAEDDISMRHLMQKLLFVFLAVGILYGIQAFLRGRNNMQYIQFVYGKSTKDFVRKCFCINYDLLEKENTRVKQQKASNCLSENFTGLEGFLRHNVELAAGFSGLVVYLALITNVSIYIVFLLLGISFLQKFVYDKAKNYEAANKTNKAKINVVQDYIRREAYDVNAGKDIRLYGLSKWLNHIFLQKNEELKQLLRKERSYFYLYDVTGLLLQFIRDAVCYAYLLYLLSKGMEVSKFVFYLGIVSGYASWFSRISDSIAQIGRDHLMICDLRTFLDMPEMEEEKDEECKEDDVPLDIVFEHVTFCYENSDKKILDDVSFHLENGQKYALVGINGAGKTTIVKLLCGFYKPTKGCIYINGIDSRVLNLGAYWKKVAVVFQDAFLHSFSIAENISGLPIEKTDRKRCQEAIRKAGLEEKIESLPNRMETYVNKDIAEDGISLSGGEVQKLMLARALYKGGSLLILDEPTAALDALAEDEIYQRYQILIQNKISLFISHRLASTRFCDTIFFLKNGKIVEHGTHDELMEQAGEYAEMFQVQSQYYQKGES